MRFATIETSHGPLRHVRVTETPEEERAGVGPYGPNAAMLFGHGGPVSMASITWPLWLVWLRPTPELGRGFFFVVGKALAMPGSLTNAPERGVQLLEVPVTWGQLFDVATPVRAYGLE